MISNKAGRAEEVAEIAGKEEVDLIVTAEAQHWFDVRWLILLAAGAMLRSGGSWL